MEKNEIVDMRVVGPAGAVVARNIHRLRKLHDWSAETLSARITEAGYPIVRSGISKIENFKRPVSIDEMVTFALVFNVSPLGILLPYEEGPEDWVEYFPGKKECAQHLWEWATADSGSTPSFAAKDAKGEDWREADRDYLTNSLPEWYRRRIVGDDD
jgi:transcriptional regulator with XRE-family HTH domain